MNWLTEWLDRWRSSIVPFSKEEIDCWATMRRNLLQENVTTQRSWPMFHLKMSSKMDSHWLLLLFQGDFTRGSSRPSKKEVTSPNENENSHQCSTWTRPRGRMEKVLVDSQTVSFATKRCRFRLLSPRCSQTRVHLESRSSWFLILESLQVSLDAWWTP